MTPMPPTNNKEEHTDHNEVKDRGVDVFRIADLLISRAIETHKDEIDIVGYYGSYAQGKARETSDLDIFYIPAEGENPPVGRTFLIKGVLFDFWAISWDTMEGFATGRNRGWSLAPSIVHHAKILHARSQEQTARFADLRQKVLDLQKPEARPQMIQRALDEFRSVTAHLGNLHLAIAADDFADVRYAGWKVVVSVWECLALANQVFFDRGLGYIVEQIPRLHSKPEDLEALIVAITTSDSVSAIGHAAEKLALRTRQLLRELQASLAHHQTAREVFASGYPEMKGGLDKILAACEQQRAVAASAAAWLAQFELSMMFNELHGHTAHSNFNLYSEFASPYRQLGFPDLMRSPAGDLSQLADQVRLLDSQLRQWLQEQSVELCEFETTEEFERST
jgi:predicted nucleotidyltransferase